MAGLPKQLQKQIKDGKKIEEQIEKELLERDGPDKTQAEIDALMLEVDPEGKIPKDKPKAEVTELHPEKTADPEPTPEPEPKPERTDWKQKYSVLQGKYDAEVPRLSSDLRDALGRIGDLETKLTAPPPAPEPKPAESEASGITDEEIKDYGEDLIDVIGRKAREIAQAEFQPMIDGLKAQINTLTDKVGATGQRVAKQEQNEVFAVLDRDVKDWREVNVDPAFNAWLEQVDPFSGQPRKRLMLDGFEAKNALRVKSFFDSFLKENAVVTPDPTPTPAGEAGAAGTLALGDYVAPGKPSSTPGQAGAPKEKRIWTNKEVGKFYSDSQKGHFKKRPDDKARIEADIMAAINEGRVQP
jgi:hypothetical protein